MTVKVLSWNIWHGKNLDQIIELIKREEPDIIALQEAIESDDRANIAHTIAQTLNYEAFFYPAFTTDRHEPAYTIGNAVLSKFPLKSGRCIVLSSLAEYQKTSETEPRVACVSQIDIDGTSVDVVSVQLAHTDSRQPTLIHHNQLDNLLNGLKTNQTIVAGDFNTLPDSSIIKALNNVLVNTDSSPQMPTKKDFKGNEVAEFRIDYIFTTPDIKTQSFKILESDASDHKPLLAALKLS
jgi:endonuclease/exonuclease/phosphatase family metal-dependent hydrolase